MLAQCVHEISTSSSLIGSLFLGGLVGSASHCTAMCGPLSCPNLRRAAQRA